MFVYKYGQAVEMGTRVELDLTNKTISGPCKGTQIGQSLGNVKDNVTAYGWLANMFSSVSAI